MVARYAPVGREQEIASMLTKKEMARVNEVYVDVKEKNRIVEKAHVRHAFEGHEAAMTNI